MERNCFGAGGGEVVPVVRSIAWCHQGTCFTGTHRCEYYLQGKIQAVVTKIIAQLIIARERELGLWLINIHLIQVIRPQALPHSPTKLRSSSRYRRDVICSASFWNSLTSYIVHIIKFEFSLLFYFFRNCLSLSIEKINKSLPQTHTHTHPQGAS